MNRKISIAAFLLCGTLAAGTQTNAVHAASTTDGRITDGTKTVLGRSAVEDAPETNAYQKKPGEDRKPIKTDGTSEVVIGNEISVLIWGSGYRDIADQYTWEWKKDGKVISTEPTYTLTEGDAGKDRQFTVRYTDKYDPSRSFEQTITIDVVQPKEELVINARNFYLYEDSSDTNEKLLERKDGVVNEAHSGNILRLIPLGKGMRPIDSSKFNWEWKKDGEVISNTDSYTLTEDDIGEGQTFEVYFQEKDTDQPNAFDYSQITLKVTEPEKELEINNVDFYRYNGGVSNNPDPLDVDDDINETAQVGDALNLTVLGEGWRSINDQFDWKWEKDGEVLSETDTLTLDTAGKDQTYYVTYTEKANPENEWVGIITVDVTEPEVKRAIETVDVLRDDAVVDSDKAIVLQEGEKLSFALKDNAGSTIEPEEVTWKWYIGDALTDENVVTSDSFWTADKAHAGKPFALWVSYALKENPEDEHFASLTVQVEEKKESAETDEKEDTTKTEEKEDTAKTEEKEDTTKTEEKDDTAKTDDHVQKVVQKETVKKEKGQDSPATGDHTETAASAAAMVLGLAAALRIAFRRRNA